MRSPHRSPIVPRRSLVLVLALGALLTACGGNGTIDASGGSEPGPTAATVPERDRTSATVTIPGLDLGADDTATTEVESDGSDDAEAVAAALAASTGIDIPPAEAQCLVDEMLSRFEPDELASARDPTDLDPDQVEQLGAAFDTCLSLDTLVAVFVEQGIPRESARCIVDVLADEGIGMGDLMAAGIDPSGPAMRRLSNRIGAAVEGC
jgi:hypothetical protein